MIRDQSFKNKLNKFRLVYITYYIRFDLDYIYKIFVYLTAFTLNCQLYNLASNLC